MEHWAQLNIEKFVLEDADAPDAPDGIEHGKKRPVNNAEFELYMEILPEGTGINASLSFENDKKDKKYTLVGSYSSGTLYSAEGERLDGWFGTDILKAADDVVYWLVETTPGIGAKIDPAHQITLIRREGTGYTNASVALEGEKKSTQVFEYVDDRVTSGSTQNFPAYGGGSAMFSTVRIAKWAGSLDADGKRVGTYTPLGNATFQLYLAHADGTIVGQLDTFTTGLDNDLTTSPSGELTAWASSKAFSFKELWEKYKDKNVPGVKQDVLWTDEEGNGYARVLLVESGTPCGL